MSYSHGLHGLHPRNPCNPRLILFSVFDLRPHAALLCASENCLDDAVRSITIFKCREDLRPLAMRDASIDVTHQVAESIRPGFLMAAGQVSISSRFSIHER